MPSNLACIAVAHNWPCQLNSMLRDTVSPNRAKCVYVWQVCGEAQYVDDLKMHNMLHAALVVSSRPHAKILSVDATAATKASYLSFGQLHCNLVL